MMVTRWIACLTLLTAMAIGPPSLGDEKVIPIEDLPRTVLREAQKVCPEAQVVAATKEDFEGSSPIYEVAMMRNGKSIILEIDGEDGVVCVEKEIEVDDLPRAVTRALARFYSNARILRVEEVSEEDDSVHYELTLVIEGNRVKEIAFSASGKLDNENIFDPREFTVEREIEADELPRAVTRAVGRFFPKAKITQVDEISDEDDQVFYRLILTVEGKKPDGVKFSPNGTILEDDEEDEHGEKPKG